MDLTPIWLTLQLASLTLLLLLVVSLTLAWWLAHTQFRFKAVIEAVTALPLVLPPTVLGFYMLLFMGPEGPLGILLGQPLTFTFTGLVLASALYSLPFVVQPLQAAFEKFDHRAYEASLTLGASRLRAYVQVVLPQIRGGLITAMVLGFAHTVGEFGVALMVGGNIPGETQVLSIAIFEQVEVMDYDAAHAYSLGLLLFAFTVLTAVYAMGWKPRREQRA